MRILWDKGRGTYDHEPSVFREERTLPVQLFVTGGYRYSVEKFKKPVENTVSDPGENAIMYILVC